MTTGLPAPADDGAADHLPGRRLPAVELPASDGRLVRLDELPARSVVFVYPSIGGPDAEELLDQWTAIPGARGCTPEACSFRDELTGFRATGFEVFGLSSQTNVSQREHVDRSRFPTRSSPTRRSRSRTSWASRRSSSTASASSGGSRS